MIIRDNDVETLRLKPVADTIMRFAVNHRNRLYPHENLEVTWQQCIGDTSSENEALWFSISAKVIYAPFAWRWLRIIWKLLKDDYPISNKSSYQTDKQNRIIFWQNFRGIYLALKIAFSVFMKYFCIKSKFFVTFHRYLYYVSLFGNSWTASTCGINICPY